MSGRAEIQVLAPGALTTVQDGGRRGWAALGYPECGAADRYSMQLANLLAGNGAASTAAVLEFTLSGAALRFEQTALIALTGADFYARLNGQPLPLCAPTLAQAGDVLALGTATEGLRGYLAVLGGIATPPVMGSRATDLKCRLGGVEGRALQKGDRLPVGGSSLEAAARFAKMRRLADHFVKVAQPLHPWRVWGAQRVPLLRAVPGPQQEAFTAAGLDAFARGLYTLTAACDRMACKLTGPVIESRRGSDILSDGIVSGSVQVAADGQPIVMLADHQTTGGYAKIATVVEPDLDVLAQCRPGQAVAFRLIDPQQAAQLYRQRQKTLQWLEEQL